MARLVGNLAALLWGASGEGPFQSLIECRLRLLVLRLRDATLFVLHLELKEFFFQSFEQ